MATRAPEWAAATANNNAKLSSIIALSTSNGTDESRTLIKACNTFREKTVKYINPVLEGLRTALPDIGIRLLVPHPEAASEDHQVREDVLRYWLHRHPNLVVDRVRLEVDGELRKSEEATGLRSCKSASNFSFLSILRFHEALDADVVFARDADNDPDLELELTRTIEAVEASSSASIMFRATRWRCTPRTSHPSRPPRSCACASRPPSRPCPRCAASCPNLLLFPSMPPGARTSPPVTSPPC